MANTILNTLTVAEAMANAKEAKTGFEEVILPAGKNTVKFIGNVEGETWTAFKLEWNGKQFNKFYNVTLYGTEDINMDLLNWIKALANITVTPNTTFQEIFNSAIGHSYEITCTNYTPTKGKNAGKLVWDIDYKVKPNHVTVQIETEEVSSDDLPF